MRLRTLGDSIIHICCGKSHCILPSSSCFVYHASRYHQDVLQTVSHLFAAQFLGKHLCYSAPFLQFYCYFPCTLSMPSPSQYAVVGSFLIGLASTNPLLAPASDTSSTAFVARNLVKGSHIDDSNYQTVLTEYTAGQTIATKAMTLIDEDNYYYELFIPSRYQSEDNANEYNNNFLAKFVTLGDDQSYTVTIDYIGLVVFSDPSLPLSSCFGRRRPISPPETCLLTLGPSLKEKY